MTAAQFASLGASAGTAIAGTAVSNLPVSTKVEGTVGTALLTAAAVPSVASPFLAIAGAISEFLGVFGVGSGCGETCVLSTGYANRAESLLQQNVQAYIAIPTPRPLSLQKQALANFDIIWSDLSQQCSNPSLGSAGQRCISDRQRGGKFNWFGWYRDIIANDANVYDDSAVAQMAQAVGTQVTSTSTPSAQVQTTSNVSAIPSIGSSITSLFLGSNQTYLLLGAAALLGVIIVSSSGSGRG